MYQDVTGVKMPDGVPDKHYTEIFNRFFAQQYNY
jgi:hypothetical protein